MSLDVVTVQSNSHQVGPQRRSLLVVARETGVSRNTVRRYARGADPTRSSLSGAVDVVVDDGDGIRLFVELGDIDDVNNTQGRRVVATRPRGQCAKRA